MPHVVFRGGNPRLDVAAAEILWRANPCAWREFAAEHGMNPLLSHWDARLVEQRILAAYQRLPAEAAAYGTACNSWWDPVSRPWFRLMASFFDFDRFGSAAEFTAWIGIGRVFPRDLASWEFLVPCSASEQTLVRLCAHETCHFYFYAKLFEMFPQRRTFLAQSRGVWMASEMLVPLVFSTEASRAILGAQPFSTYACPPSRLGPLLGHVQRRGAGEISFDSLLAAFETALGDWPE